MIRMHLSAPDLDSERAGALGYYTDLLVDAASPEAVLIQDALARLEPHREPAEIQRAALLTADHAEAYVAQRQGRALPDRLDNALQADRQPPLAAFDAQAVEAAQSLRERASR